MNQSKDGVTLPAYLCSEFGCSELPFTKDLMPSIVVGNQDQSGRGRRLSHVEFQVAYLEFDTKIPFELVLEYVCRFYSEVGYETFLAHAHEVGFLFQGIFGGTRLTVTGMLDLQRPDKNRLLLLTIPVL